MFGVVTRGGESTTLTYRMLRSLMEQTVLISGRVTATVSDGMTFSIRCIIGTTPENHDRTTPLDSTLFAGDLKAPLLLLMESRPEGWPR